jgi:protoporphyrinogen IX oxidase
MASLAMYLWIKAFHIIFMVCWFAGMFYLPRLFVNHAMAEDPSTRRQLALMEYKLYRFVTPFAWLTIGLGLWMLWLGWSGFKSAIWMWTKLGLVATLASYHLYCGHLVRVFADDRNVRSHVFYRWFNEFPVLVLFGAVILVVLKPF